MHESVGRGGLRFKISVFDFMALIHLVDFCTSGFVHLMGMIDLFGSLEV